MTRLSYVPFESSSPTLYLNVDGVLHAGRTSNVNGQILVDTGHAVFEYANVLVGILAPYARVQIVLTVAWLLLMDPDAINRTLPKLLRRRIVTCACGLSAPLQCRHGTADPASVIEHARRNDIKTWLCLHDGTFPIPPCQDEHFLKLDRENSLGCSAAVNHLRAWLWTNAGGTEGNTAVVHRCAANSNS